MLRAFLIGVSVLLLICAAALFVVGQAQPALLTVLGWALILFIGVVFERTRYKAILDVPPDAGFEPTAERFVDPETKVETVVYFNAKTGKRAYVKAQS
jgi:hypothetical protein